VIPFFSLLRKQRADRYQIAALRPSVASPTRTIDEGPPPSLCPETLRSVVPFEGRPTAKTPKNLRLDGHSIRCPFVRRRGRAAVERRATARGEGNGHSLSARRRAPRVCVFPKRAGGSAYGHSLCLRVRSSIATEFVSAAFVATEFISATFVTETFVAAASVAATERIQ